MSKQVSVQDAKAQLSRLINEVVAGEEVIITRRNQPMVKLVAVPSARAERSFGSAKGAISMADDFDAPLDDFALYRDE